MTLRSSQEFEVFKRRSIARERTFELLDAEYPGGSRGLGAFGLRLGGLSSWIAQKGRGSGDWEEEAMAAVWRGW